MQRSPLYRQLALWILPLALFLLVNGLGAFWHVRWDLTQEKRYTISPSTIRMLHDLREPVSVEILLEGDLPAGFRKLQQSAQDMLQSFKEYGRGNLKFVFRKPLEGLDDTARAQVMDSLQRIGLSAMNVQAQSQEGQKKEEHLVYPGAVVRLGDRYTAVDFLQGQSSVDGINSLNNAEALLEYKLASSIHKLTQDHVPTVGYLLGNGEPFGYNVYDLIQHNLKKDYGFGAIPIDSVRFIPPIFDALFVVKPTRPFTDGQKLKLDQYIMHGGKVIWMIDNLFAEMDSLQRSQNQFIAFDRGLNLEDLLFKYGVRVNQDLVQDANCDRLPSVIGQVGDRPQIELLAWPYFPLLSESGSNHPISKNLDYVLAEFPNSLDTVKAPGIRKTWLLSSSEATKVLTTPARVAWNFIQTKEEAASFTHPPVGVAVLLEGSFHSAYEHRIPQTDQDSLASMGRPFLEKAQQENKMIVISNGEIAMNPVSQTEGPLQMGMNPYTKYKYANAEFLMNAVQYLVDSSGILETRAKDYTLRLLDKKKVESGKSFWQLTNIVLPMLSIVVFGLLYQGWRSRKYRR